MYRICVSENGWTDNELGRQWLEKDFDAQTKEKAAGHTRILLVDGHKSHVSCEFLEYAKTNDIEVLGYPPHCTHALQGLDVVCFAKMKDAWKKEIHAFEEANHCGIGKGNFAELFGKAFQSAFTPDTIKAAFRATGIHPYNANIIRPEQMRPSEPTSTKSSFPIPQTSPVRAFMSAYHNFHPTTADLDRSNYIAPGPSTIQPTSSPHSPQTHGHDAMIDPSLQESPSKRMRMTISALASTSTGHALVSTTPINVSFRISSPVLETPPTPPPPHSPKDTLSPSQMSRAHLEASYRTLLAKNKEQHQLINMQNGIIQRTNAQMVIQNLYCKKLNEKLNAKESKEPDDHTVLLRGGKGRHWTDEDVIKSLRESQAAREAEVVDKDRRKAERMAKAEQRKLADTEWKRVVAEHESAKITHADNIKRLRTAGVRVKDLPKPPVRELQASVYARFGIGPKESDDNGQQETVSQPVTQAGHSWSRLTEEEVSRDFGPSIL